MLRVNTTLRVLTLHNTMVGDDGLFLLGQGLMQNRTIEQFALNSDAITDEGLRRSVFGEGTRVGLTVPLTHSRIAGFIDLPQRSNTRAITSQ